MKKFLFLYPIKDYLEWEIKNNSAHMYSKEARNFRENYIRMLNECIDLRYRQRDFEINFAVFDDKKVSKIIHRKNSDRVIRVGLDFKTHVSEKIYPDDDHILNQLINGEQIEHLRVCGFHIWDCVTKLAKRAHERGINVLIDEDLTQLFFGLVRFIPDFKKDEFPSHHPTDFVGMEMKYFLEPRKNRPWMFSDY